MWKLRIKQYFQVQDYALWEVIEYGNSFKPVARTTTNADGTSTSTIPGLVTTEENAQKKNDVKARSMLLMALPNEHQLTFSQYKDAKTLFEAIQARFESLDSISNRLLSEWSMHVVIWRNKPDMGIISFDDLYNNFKIVEQEVKRSVTSSSNSSSQNVAFVSTPGSTNEDNTANVQDSTASTHVNTASTNNSTASLNDATFYAFPANKPNGSQVVHEDSKARYPLITRTGKKIIINGSDTAGYDKSNVECFNCHKMGHFARECRGPRNQENRPRNQESMPRNQESSKRTVNVEDTSSKAMVAFDGAEKLKRLKKEKESNQFKIDNFENASKSLDKLIGSQISDNNRKGVGYNAVAPPPTGLFAPPTIDLSNSGLEEFKQHEFEGYGVKVKKNVSENSSNEIKKTSGAPIIKDWVSDCDEDETLEKVSESANVQKPKQADQPREISQNPRNSNCDFHDKNMVQKPVLNNEKKGTGQREVRPVWNNAMRTNHRNFSNSRRNFAPTAVLTKSGLVSISTARQNSSRAATRAL
ncbi:ribonuclease H-like domain-containing protein [Tanacetum coccineum]